MAKINLRIRNEIYLRDGGCLVCGTTVNLTIDHIVPLIKGGQNKYENFQTLCKRHNNIKADVIVDYRKVKRPLDEVEGLVFVRRKVLPDIDAPFIPIANWLEKYNAELEPNFHYED